MVSLKGKNVPTLLVSLLSVRGREKGAPGVPSVPLPKAAAPEALVPSFPPPPYPDPGVISLYTYADHVYEFWQTFVPMLKVSLWEKYDINVNCILNRIKKYANEQQQ